MWILFALGSAFFAGLTSVVAKCGIKKTDSTVATAIRTGVVLICSAVMVTIVGSWDGITNVDTKSRIFLVLSWLCYYRVLQLGEVSVVVPIDKLSILVSIAFSYIVFKEKLTLKSFMGLMIIVVGTLCLLL